MFCNEEFGSVQYLVHLYLALNVAFPFNTKKYYSNSKYGYMGVLMASFGAMGIVPENGLSGYWREIHTDELGTGI